MEIVILFTMTDYHITSGWESLRLYLWLPMCQTASACGLTSLVGIVLNCTVVYGILHGGCFRSILDKILPSNCLLLPCEKRGEILI